MPALPSGRWLIRESAPDGYARLFCFPFAGVGASSFRRWPRQIGPMEVCPIQLPGRENRMRESAYETFEEFASEAALGLRPHLDRPFAFFGHCMGALLAYALLVQLHKQEAPVPFRFFVSSSLPPHLGFFGPFHPSMPDAQLASEIRKVIASLGEEEPIPDLVGLSVRILRKDVEMFFKYRAPTRHVLPCPVTTFAWSDDRNVKPEEMMGWGDYGEVSHRLLAGDSLTFLTAPESLLAAIEQDSDLAASAEERPLEKAI
jgi:surfactin synthase thioesterase subunit